MVVLPTSVMVGTYTHLYFPKLGGVKVRELLDLPRNVASDTLEQADLVFQQRRPLLPVEKGKFLTYEESLATSGDAFEMVKRLQDHVREFYEILDNAPAHDAVPLVVEVHDAPEWALWIPHGGSEAQRLLGLTESVSINHLVIDGLESEQMPALGVSSDVDASDLVINGLVFQQM